MKRLLTWSAFVVLSGISLVAVVQGVRSELRREPSFDRDMLTAWLSEDHAAPSTGELRRAARRLELDFHEEFDWLPTYDTLDVARRPTFETNFGRLVVSLVERQSDLFAAVPNRRRELFLDSRLSEVQHWYAIVDGRRVQGPSLLMQTWFGPSAGLMKNAPQQAREYAAALQARAMQRLFNRVVPQPAPPRDD